MIALILAAAVAAHSVEGPLISVADAKRVAQAGGVAAHPADGPLISLADAKRVMAAAVADAAKRKVSATIAIVDRYGELVLAQTSAEAEGAALDTALLTARSIVNYGAGALHDQQRDGGSSAPRASAGGAPLISNGKIVGAVSDVGAAANVVAKAGAEVLK